MIPLTFEAARIKVMVVGDGPAARRRLEGLRRGGAAGVRVFAEQPCAALVVAAGDDLRRRLPSDDELGAAHLVFIAGIEAGRATRMAAAARAGGAMVNVEDMAELCDFHLPATVRRGDLTIAVSTAGRAPGLAGRLKRHLSTLIDAGWETRLHAIAGARAEWRAGGDDIATLARKTEAYIDARGWLA